MSSANQEEKPLRVALAGLGRVAVKHLQALRHQEKLRRVQLVAILDSSEEKARTTLARSARAYFADRPVYGDLHQLLADKPIDLLSIATPSGTHASLARTALEANCHLLIEKPMAMTVEDCRQIMDLARQKERKIALGHIYRYFPAMASLRSDLARGRMGRPLYGQVSLRWGHGQDYYDQASWRGSKAMDGGVIMNQSVHAMDLMQWLLLADDCVDLCARSDLLTHRMECEDFGMGIFRFNNGSWMGLEASSSSDPSRKEASFFLLYEGGELRAGLDGRRIRLSVRERGGKELAWQYIRRDVWRRFREEGLAGLGQIGNPHNAIYADLVAAIRGGRQPLADAESGLRSVQLVLKMLAACEAGRS